MLKLILLGSFLASAQVVITLNTDQFLTLQTAVLNSLNQTQKTAYNNYIFDIALYEYCQVIRNFGFDPFKLQDTSLPLSYRQLVITYHGGVSLTEGYAYNVADIKRNGDVTLSYDNRFLLINIPLKIDQIPFRYNYDENIMRVHPSGRGINGSVSDIHALIKITVDFWKMRITLDNFDITRNGDINFVYTGDRPPDWFINIATPAVNNHLSNTFVSRRNLLKALFEQNLKAINDWAQHKKQ